jgi:salicylate hydroxylase
MAIVLGGGIGGLTAALSLIDAGHQVRVFEQAAAVTAVGAGLQLSPNAARVLHNLGLGSALRETAVLPVALESRHWQDGRLLGNYEINGSPAPYGAPHYLIYRPDLLAALAAALPGGVMSLGCRAIAVSQDDASATVSFADGGEASGDFIVGADGIHSVVRSALFGPDKPVFSGTVAYRGLLPAAKVRHLQIPNTSTKWWGPVPDHHLVHYHIAGGDLVNVVGIVPEEWHTESWTARGAVPDFAAAFAGFHRPVPELIDAVEETYKFAIYDRPPLPEWTSGRISLLGDACHPMVPFMAQGAAMAVEDAAILGRVMAGAGPGDVPGALLRYGHIRQQRTSRMQEGSRADTSGTWGTRDWVYGYDVYSEPLTELA